MDRKDMNSSRPDISVIIPTRNRAASLQVTLECLAAANRDGLNVELIVVNNGSSDHTEEVAQSFAKRISVRYLYEPALGKSHALNCALDAGNLGDIVAVLDDDMSPDGNWFQGVAAISRRWPEKDLFTGFTPIVWPSTEVPVWATRPNLQSWLFSAGYIPEEDAHLQEGRWFLGGHFWFRSRVLDGGRRFKDIWITEPDFQLDLVQSGASGVSARDAKAGHRIQPYLLDKEVVLERARKTGKSAAWLRLHPYREHMKQARMLNEYPLLGRIFCLLNHVRWMGLYYISYLFSADGTGFERRLIAIERMATYVELFRAANQLEAYSLSRRVRTAVMHSRSNAAA